MSSPIPERLHLGRALGRLLLSAAVVLSATCRSPVRQLPALPIRLDGPIHESILLQAHEYFITNLALSADGNTLISMSIDGQLHVWRRQGSTFIPRSSFRPFAYSHGAMVLSPDGRTLFASGLTRERVAGSDVAHAVKHHIGQFDLEGTAEPTLHETNGPIGALALDPEGRSLVAGELHGSRRMGPLLGWLPIVRGRIKGKGRLIGVQPAGMRSAAFHPSGRYLAASVLTGVRIWERRKDGSFSERETLIGLGKKVRAIAFDPSGLLLAAVSDEELLVWRYSCGRFVRAAPVWRGTDLGGVTFSPDGRLLVVTSERRDRNLFFWRISSSGQIVRMGTPSLPTQTGSMHPVWLPTGDGLVSVIDCRDYLRGAAPAVRERCWKSGSQFPAQWYTYRRSLSALRIIAFKDREAAP